MILTENPKAIRQSFKCADNNTLITENIDIMSETLDYLYKNNDMLYTSLLEYSRVCHMYKKYDDVELLTEGVTELVTRIKNIITNIINIITGLFKKFVKIINSMCTDDVFIKRYMQTLKKIKIPDDFNYNGFIFTTYSNKIPNIPYIEKINNSITKDLMSINNKISVAHLTKLKKYACDDEYSNIRGKVLLKPYSIYKVDFLDECFKTFRNGAYIEQELSLSASERDSYINILLNYKKEIEDMRNISDTIIDFYNKLYIFFDKSFSVRYSSKNPRNRYSFITLQDESSKQLNDMIDNIDMTDEDFKIYADYMELRVKQMKELGDIFTIAFSSKTSAIVSNKIQARKVLQQLLLVDLRTKIEEEV